VERSACERPLSSTPFDSRSEAASGGVRQIAEWPLPFCLLSRSVAYPPSEVKMPGYEGAMDLATLPRKPPHFLRVDPKRRNPVYGKTVRTTAGAKMVRLVLGVATIPADHMCLEE